MTIHAGNRYENIITEISGLNWDSLNRDDLIAVSNAYYYFSTQFRESLEAACELYPSDPKLMELRAGECDTDNLCPYPGIAEAGEKMNHDEFMRRVVAMSSMDPAARRRVAGLGESYLAGTRKLDRLTQAMSISSYEDGGLEKVFRAILRAPDWDEPSLQAFRHFLVEHIRLDSGPGVQHGALCRHLIADDRIMPLWSAFKRILIESAPRLAEAAATPGLVTEGAVG